MNQLFKKFLVGVALVSAVGWLGQSVAFADKSTDEKLSKLEDRILELEAQSSLNKVRFSGTFLSRFESLTNKHGQPGSLDQIEKVNPMGMAFALNADFDATKNLKFYSTLGMSKFFNNEGRTESLDPDSFNGYATYQATETSGWAYSGAVPRIDRAYASYEFDRIPLTLAIGRMPTNNGPPSNQLDGLPRQGTYPRFAFNAIFDGMAAVYDFSSLLPRNNSLKLRAFYQPFIQVDKSDRTKQMMDGNRIMSNSPQFAFLTEYAHTGLSFVDRLDLMYMMAWWSKFYTGYFSTDSTGATVVPPAPLGSPPTGQVEYGGDHMFYVGLENVGHVGLNLSWSGLFYHATDSFLPDVHKKAGAHLVNINQKLWFLGKKTFLADSVLGYEYIRTQTYWYLDEWTRLNIIPFYSLQNAVGHHGFFGFPVAEKIGARVGYYRLVAATGDVFQPEASDAYSYYAQVRFSF